MIIRYFLSLHPLPLWSVSDINGILTKLYDTLPSLAVYFSIISSSRLQVAKEVSTLLLKFLSD